MHLQWRNQIWQSLEEGAGKRCSECEERDGEVRDGEGGERADRGVETEERARKREREREGEREREPTSQPADGCSTNSHFFHSDDIMT